MLLNYTYIYPLNVCMLLIYSTPLIIHAALNPMSLHRRVYQIDILCTVMQLKSLCLLDYTCSHTDFHKMIPQTYVIMTASDKYLFFFSLFSNIYTISRYKNVPNETIRSIWKRKKKHSSFNQESHNLSR